MAHESGTSSHRGPDPVRRAVAARVLLALSLLLPLSAAGAPPCEVSVTTDIAFGVYDVFSPAPLLATGRIRLRCPQAQNPRIALGLGSSATYRPRKLQGPGDVLEYNLFIDPGHLTIWGDGSDGSSMFTAPSGSGQFVIYAMVPAAQNVRDGAYSDSLLLTLYP
jgi:spore coat protein U-like protein